MLPWGCGRERKSLGLCATHYKAQQRKRGIQRTSTRTCDDDACVRPHYASGLCKKHYAAANREPMIGPRRPPGRKPKLAECLIGDCDRTP